VSIGEPLAAFVGTGTPMGLCAERGYRVVRLVRLMVSRARERLGRIKDDWSRKPDVSIVPAGTTR
jgi:hypothetical protein